MKLFNPSVVIFDESFANLDAATAQRLTKLVISNKERTVIVVAHQILDEIAQLFDKRIIINGTTINVED